MATQAHIHCDECGRPMDKARLIRDGKALCDTCSARVPFAPCRECGNNTRMLDEQGQALCKSCKTKDRSCLRCGKPLPRASLLVEGGAVCWPCSRHYREPEACEQCGQMELTLTGIETGAGRRRVCGKCWRRHKGYANCSVCHKHRPPAGITAEGKPICKVCQQANGTPFVCPKCAQEGIRHSSTRCQVCYQRDTVQKRVEEAAVLIQHTWAKDAWSGFGAAILKEMKPEKVMLRINNYYLLFARLDLAFAKPTEITPVALLKAVGGLEGLRRFAIPYGYLLKQEIIPETTRNLLEDEAESVRQEAMLIALDGKWYAPVLARYRQHLMIVRARYDSRGWKGENSRMKARTITSNLRSARRFCEMLDTKGVQMIQQATPELLDTFLVECPGLAASISGFVRFLNRKEKLFQRLSLKAIARNLPEGIFLPREKYLGLLRDWLSPADDVLRESLIGLFMLLYAQTIKRCIRIRLDDLSQGRDKRFRIAFGRAEIHLDARISVIMERYLNQRRTLAALDHADDNPYLFPGRQFGNHLNATTVSIWLKMAGVRAEQLFATAIYTAYQNGLRLPKVLVRAFGITVPTAIKYLNMLDPRLVMEIERKPMVAE